MKLRAKILAGLAVVTVAIQLFRPARNVSAGPFSDDIFAHYDAPDPVKALIHENCYDCHSDNTRYPWYTNVQPVGWWMAWHVREGKKELNYSAFATYTAKRAAHKMKEIREQVEEREMPLPSYSITHRNAKLTDEQIKLVAAWARGLEAKISKPVGQ